jgi:cell division transport system ATP-binding protein
MIEMQQIVRFDNGKIAHTVSNEIVLDQVGFSVSKGEFVYLIGKTGSGKSSLLKTMYGAMPLRGGAGHVAGHDLAKLSRASIPQLRRKLGIVFQDFNLLNDRNVYQNLHFVLSATDWKDKDAINKRIAQVLEAVQLPHVATKMPYQLSGGEQQRIVIARALLNQPALILADEPTGNLDPDTSDEMLVLIRNLAQQFQTAVLLATHDYRILEHFPARIMRCSNGKVYDEKNFIL